MDNPKPTNGLGPVLRCSSAFDITEVIFVGVAKCNTQGAHGANRHLQITSVATWEKAIAYVKDSSNENCINVIGIDGIRGFQGKMIERGNNNEFSTIIDDFYSKLENLPVHSMSFDAKFPTAFIILDQRNSRNGQNDATLCEQLKMCTSIVHVQHFHPSNQLLIDTPSRLSIVLHYYNSQVGMKERHSEGFKFNVQSRQKVDSRLIEKLRNERQVRKKESEEEANAMYEEEAWGSDFFN